MIRRLGKEVVKRITYADIIVGSWLIVGLIAYPLVVR